METLELEPLETSTTLAPAAETAVGTLKTPKLKEIAVAVLEGARPGLVALAARYANVAFDLKTTAGLTGMKAARHDLRTNGRYLIQNARDAIKKELNSAKPKIEQLADELIALVKTQEDEFDKAIEAREVELEAEAKVKKAREAAEAAERERLANERRAGFEAEIARIVGYVAAAEDKTAEWLATKGIPYVNMLTIDPEIWGEYTQRAQDALSNTRATLQAMHTRKVAEEATAAANAEALRKAELMEARMQEMQAIQQQVAIATLGRAGVRQGGTMQCIRDTLAETEAWPVTEEGFGTVLFIAAKAVKDKAVAEIRALLEAKTQELTGHVAFLQEVVNGQHDAVPPADLLTRIDAATVALSDSGSLSADTEVLAQKAVDRWSDLDMAALATPSNGLIVGAVEFNIDPGQCDMSVVHPFRVEQTITLEPEAAQARAAVPPATAGADLADTGARKAENPAQQREAAQDQGSGDAPAHATFEPSHRPAADPLHLPEGLADEACRPATAKETAQRGVESADIAETRETAIGAGDDAKHAGDLRGPEDSFPHCHVCDQEFFPFCAQAGCPSLAELTGTPISQDAKERGCLPADAPAPRDDAVLNASNGGQSAQPSPSGAEGSAVLADQRTAEPDFSIDLPALDEPSAADVSLETSEREAFTPPGGLVPLAEPTRPSDEVLLRLCMAMVDHCALAFEGRFPSHPKPDAAWWGALRTGLTELRPLLAERVGSA